MTNLALPHSWGLPVVQVDPIRGVGPLWMESLGSWIHRFRLQNGFFSNYQALRCSRSINDAAWDSDLVAAHISEASLTPPEVIGAMMLSRELAVLGINASAGPQWLRRVPKEYASLKGFRHGLRHAICPLCLKEHAEAPWSKAGRLSQLTRCSAHLVPLLEDCPRCASPFVTHTHRTAELWQCEHCLLDLRNVATNRSDDFQPPAFLTHLGGASPDMLPATCEREADWWVAVKRILTLVEDPQRAKTLAWSQLPPDASALLEEISSSPRSEFCLWPAKLRERAVSFMHWLASAWPTRLVEWFSSINLRWRAIGSLNAPGCAWLYSTLDKHFPPLRGRKTRSRALSVPEFIARVAAPGAEGRRRHQPLLGSSKAADLIQALNWRLRLLRGRPGQRHTFFRRLAATPGAAHLSLPCSGKRTETTGLGLRPSKPFRRDELSDWLAESRRPGQGLLFDHMGAPTEQVQRLSEPRPGLQPSVSMLGSSLEVTGAWT